MNAYDSVAKDEAFVVWDRFGNESVYIVENVTPKRFTMKQWRGTCTDTYAKKTGKVVGYNVSGRSIVRRASSKDFGAYEDKLNKQKAERDARENEQSAAKKRAADLIAPLANGPFAGQVTASWMTAGTNRPGYEVTFHDLNEQQAKILIERLVKP